MQELVWTACCRKVKKNIVGNTVKLVVADKLPCALSIAVVEWLAEPFPAQSSVGQDKHLQTVNRNARRCTAGLEMHMSTWEVNGVSKAVFPGTQLPFTCLQWAVAVTTAQDVVDAWPADVSEHLT
eukprot:4459911-Pleurochrysis_carterae.AAC.1